MVNKIILYLHVTAGLTSPLFTIKIIDKILPEQLQPTFILGPHSVSSFIQYWIWVSISNKLDLGAKHKVMNSSGCSK